MTNFRKVGHFMKTFGQEIKTKPGLSTEKINNLSSKLNKKLENRLNRNDFNHFSNNIFLVCRNVLVRNSEK